MNTKARFSFRPAAALLALCLSACGGPQGTGRADYAVTAQRNYEKGEAQLKAEDWIAAAKYFAFIKARFPYSRFAVLAELRLADAEFGAENFLQAVDAYKLFTKFHPTHPMVQDGYTSYRVGEAYYKMVPGDWWLLPPSHEKDQSALADAHRQLQNFVRKYPKSPYLPKAQELLIQANYRLAKHEMYAARFYWERKKPMGTVLRLRTLLKEHKGTKLDPDAMYLLGKAYKKVKMPARAKTVWEELVKEFPQHANASKAREALSSL